MARRAVRSGQVVLVDPGLRVGQMQAMGEIRFAIQKTGQKIRAAGVQVEGPGAFLDRLLQGAHLHRGAGILLVQFELGFRLRHVGRLVEVVPFDHFVQVELSGLVVAHGHAGQAVQVVGIRGGLQIQGRIAR